MYVVDQYMSDEWQHLMPERPVSGDNCSSTEKLRANAVRASLPSSRNCNVHEEPVQLGQICDAAK